MARVIFIKYRSLNTWLFIFLKNFKELKVDIKKNQNNSKKNSENLFTKKYYY